MHIVLVVHLLIDKVVKGLPIRDVSGVQPHNCSQESSVPGVHQVTGVVVSRHGVKVVHRGHLILNGDGEVVAVLHQLLDHAVDQLYFGILPLIEKQALSALGQEGVDAQDHRGGGREDGRASGGISAALGALAAPAVQVPLGQPHEQVQDQGGGQ